MEAQQHELAKVRNINEQVQQLTGDLKDMKEDINEQVQQLTGQLRILQNDNHKRIEGVAAFVIASQEHHEEERSHNEEERSLTRELVSEWQNYFKETRAGRCIMWVKNLMIVKVVTRMIL